jgi:hypothetical protein
MQAFDCLPAGLALKAKTFKSAITDKGTIVMTHIQARLEAKNQ